MIRTKSVHSPVDPRVDGLRILATRYRGRRIANDRFDVWMANLGPSEALLESFQRGETTWPEFKRRYRAELKETGAIDRRNPFIKNHGQKFTLRLLQELARRGTVTVLCHCAEDETHCHRHELAKILKGKIA